MNDQMPPIVVVAYNRHKSLARLLSSLKKAIYPKNSIPLIISIDHSDGNEEVRKIANLFAWENGKKIVVEHEKNLGLKNHILLCGEYATQYGNVIILEDDLYVSKNFYNYCLEALAFSSNKDYIGGISLYNHKINVHCGEYFTAYEDGYDNWYFQFASSWGQAWSKKNWIEFKEWYNSNLEIRENDSIPKNVTNWSNKSWLKFFIAYLIEKDKFFLYPKISLSTNFNDKGTHVGSDSTAYQLEMLHNSKKEYNFSEIEESKAVYDAFFENLTLKKSFKTEDAQNVTIDLYGNKPIVNESFLLTSKKLNHKITQSFGRSLKPIEANVIEGIEGNEIFCYDLNSYSKNSFPGKKNSDYRKIVYSAKVISFEAAKTLFTVLFMEKAKNLLNKIKLKS